MNYIINHYKKNSLVILFFLATTLTCLNVSNILFFFSLLLTLLVISVPVWSSKKEISLYQEMVSIANNLLSKINGYKQSYQEKRANDFQQQLIGIEKAQRKQYDTLLEMAMLNIPLEERERVLGIIDSLDKNEGENLVIALSGSDVDRMAVYKVLNNLEKTDRDILQPIIDKINTEKMHDNMLNSNASYQEFSMQKSGVWLNVLIILMGTIFLVFAYNFLMSMELGLGIPASMTVVIAIAFFFSLIHYLPTFIYHASLGGKILMFIANSLISVLLIATPIAWLILLVVANSQNKKERYKQELNHLLKNMNQNKR